MQIKIQIKVDTTFGGGVLILNKFKPDKQFSMANSQN